MKSNANHRRLLLGVIVFTLVLGMGLSAIAFAQEKGANPRSDTWRAVRQGVAGTTSVDSEAHEVLIQTEGQLWRRLRNGPLASIGPWVLAGVLAAIALFFVIAGRDRLEEPRTGEMIPRYSLAERLLHWTTAVLFVVLALTGLSMLFGRAALIPVFGQGAFAGYMQVAMYVHNVSGPLFLACLLVEFVAWVRHNIPKRMDLRWFRNLGGMVGKGPRPHAEKVNGGEKAWFWLMVLAGIGVGITGVLLDFPIWGQTRQTLQIAHIVHASVAILFVAASFGHIYIGTIGTEGTFEGMWRGRVDAAWAKQHQDLWYEKMTGREGA
ncbi:MAG TPA: formate dehydrogenase subunit gamma [Desulfosarcina sp.]|nr:formate dehydrogenase subunit gamma [Desulfosarcina sp.]